MFFAIDFEATQFSERIISIGCVAENGERFKTLVKPPKKKDKVNKFITSLTGITNDMLEKAPSLTEAFSLLMGFVNAYSPQEKPIFYCYGDCDARFITRSIDYIEDANIKAFVSGLHLQDYSKQVKKFFGLNSLVSLKKVYMVTKHIDEYTQNHDALDDARMLQEVVLNMEKECRPEDKEKFKQIKSDPRPCPSGSIRNAPPLFISWDNTSLWEADTLADENNWYLSATAGPHTKYFDSLDTAMMWVIRFCTSNKSVKKIAHQEEAKEKILLGVYSNKKSYSFEWKMKGEA